MIPPVLQGHPAVAVAAGQRLRHPQPARQLVIEALRFHRVRLGVAALPGVLPGAFPCPVVLVRRKSLAQIPVPAPGSRHGPAGVADRDVLDREGRRPQPLRPGVDDVRLDPLPVGRPAGALQPGHGLVVVPAGGIKPDPQRHPLLLRRIDPYLARSRCGSGGVHINNQQEKVCRMARISSVSSCSGL